MTHSIPIADVHGADLAYARRDIERFETILSGDLAGDDGPPFERNDENSLHVVTGSGPDATAVMDGVTVKAGVSEFE